MVNNQQNTETKRYYTNISITAYRAIKILKLLLEKPCSHAELQEAIKNDEIINRSTSDDTLRVTINSLKAVGCEILRPTLKNNHKYILKYHPFNIKFSEAQIKILNKIRKNFLCKNDWQTVLKLNDLYDKIVEFANDENVKNLINHKKPFSGIKPEVKEWLLSGDIKNKEIVVTYTKKAKKQEIINIITDKIFCEAERIYIWAWSCKYNHYVYFKADCISKIHSIHTVNKEQEKIKYKAIYKLTGSDLKTFKCNEEEKIINFDENSIIVEYSVMNEFKFFQKLLSFGENFEIIEPDFIKQKFFDKLAEIEKRYE